MVIVGGGFVLFDYFNEMTVNVFPVKLPDFLSATNIAEEKLRLILKHLDDFME